MRYKRRNVVFLGPRFLRVGLVDFDILHPIEDPSIDRSHQGERRVDRNSAVHGVVGVAEAEIKHLPGHVRLTNPEEIPDGKFVPGW